MSNGSRARTIERPYRGSVQADTAPFSLSMQRAQAQSSHRLQVSGGQQLRGDSGQFARSR